MGTQDEFMAEASESTQGREKGGPRLFIKEMVMRNFKSYAGEQRVGPFHKVRVFFEPSSLVQAWKVEFQFEFGSIQLTELNLITNIREFREGL